MNYRDNFKTYLPEFKTQKQFFGTSIPLKDFENMYQKCFNVWPLVKLMLKHKDCPLSINEHLTSSDKWHERLVAYCAKPHRKYYFKKAISDSKSTVRAAAWKGAMFDASTSKEFNDLLNLALKDERIHGYLRGYEEMV